MPRNGLDTHAYVFCCTRESLHLSHTRISVIEFFEYSLSFVQGNMICYRQNPSVSLLLVHLIFSLTLSVNIET